MVLLFPIDLIKVEYTKDTNSCFYTTKWPNMLCFNTNSPKTLPYLWNGFLKLYQFSLTDRGEFPFISLSIEFVIQPYSTVFWHFGNLFVWYYEFVLMLSSDIHENPAPSDDHEKGINSGVFSFCNWSLNTDDFHRVSLIEAKNTLFNYDIISPCETCLNDDLKVPDNMLNDYTYYGCNHPSGEKNGVLEYSINHPFILR